MTLIKNRVLNIWKKIACGSASRADFPVGTLTMYLGNTAPTDWLICDGSVFDKTVYVELYNILGTNVLPDLRECTTKGTGTNTNGAVHNSVALGAFQNDSVKIHSHTMSHTHTRGTMNITGQATKSVRSDTVNSGALYVTGDARHPQYNLQLAGRRASISLDASKNWSGVSSEPSNANTSNAGSITTEMKAVGVNYIIKAR